MRLASIPAANATICSSHRYVSRIGNSRREGKFACSLTESTSGYAGKQIYAEALSLLRPPRVLRLCQLSFPGNKQGNSRQRGRAVARHSGAIEGRILPEQSAASSMGRGNGLLQCAFPVSIQLQSAPEPRRSAPLQVCWRLSKKGITGHSRESALEGLLRVQTIRALAR